MGKKYTKKESDFWGKEKEVHYENGKKVGETNYKETIFGNKVQEHFDVSGNKTGVTKKKQGLFSSRAVHFDYQGERTGFSKDGETLLGNKVQHHFSKDGKRTGTSHYEDGIFRGHKKVHKGEYYKASSEGSDEKKSSSVCCSTGESGNISSGNNVTKIWPTIGILIAISLIGAFLYWGPLLVLENIAMITLGIIAFVVVAVLAAGAFVGLIPFFIGAGGISLISKGYVALGIVVIIIAIGIGAYFYNSLNP